MQNLGLLFTLSLSTLLASACVTEDDATDPASADDPTSETTSETTSSIVGGPPVTGTCAVNHEANYTLYGTSGSYTRSTSQIEQTCACEAFQDDPSITTCRPGTFVEVPTSQGQPYQFFAEVPDWGITDTGSAGETMCRNSTLSMRLDRWNTTTNVWEQVFPSNGTALTKNATWIKATSKCLPLSAVSFENPQWGGDSIGGPTFRVRAIATRGLPEFKHGFAGVKIHAEYSGL